MKYYVEGKYFDNLDEAKEEEKKLELAKKEKEEKIAKKKERAEEVQEAFKKLNDTRKKCFDEIDKAQEEYIKLRDEFVKDFGSWHFTYTNNNGEETYSLSDLFDGTQRFLKDFFGL